MDSVQKHLRDFADEQRAMADIAIQAFTAIRTGTIGFRGATGTLLAHTLGELRSLADRTLP